MGLRLTISRVSGFKKGKAQEFDQGPVTLGTEPACDVTFDAAWDKTVSPRHATLEARDNTWTVSDQSRDGTWIEGRKVSRQQLKSGDVLELGPGGPKVKVDLAHSGVGLPPVPAERLAAGVVSAQATASPLAGTHPSISPSPAVPTRISPPPPPPPAGKSSSPLLYIGVVALVLLGAVGVWFILSHQRGGTEDAQLADAAKRLESSIGLVVLIVPTSAGDRSYPIATAWEFGEHTFATNGHVAQPVRDALAKGESAFIVINRNPNLRYKITAAEPDPKYGQKVTNADGKEPAVPAYDVGLLTVAETLPNPAPVASADELAALDSGDRIAYLGFPMENLAGDGTDFQNPVATMQSGIITSVTDYWMAKADGPHRLLIQHNLGATGGASGSPIFNTRGEVIGILSAGNIIGQIDAATGQPARAPSGVMINFAQRVDILNELNHGNAP